MLFHFVHLVWIGDPLPYYFTYQFSSSFSIFIRLTELFWYSGWAIVFLFAFLYGMRWGRGKAIPYSLVAVLLLLQLVLSFAFWRFEKFELFWDVYGFLAMGFLLCRWLSVIQSRQKIFAIILLGFVFSFFEFNHLRWFSGSALASILWGGCANGNSGFPLFPFVGLFASFYFVGFLFQSKALEFLKLLPKRPELLTWLGLLVFSAMSYPPTFDFFKGVYLLGECRMFDLPRLYFWGGLISFLFFLRIALIEKLNDWLSPYLQWLKRLEISRNFAGVYIGTYVFAAAVVHFAQPHLQKNLVLFYGFAFLTYPVVELLFHLYRRRRITWF